jgi:glycosyltransferase involved in cell wall biosynthesis
VRIIFIGHRQYGKRGGVRIFECLKNMCDSRNVYTSISEAETSKNVLGLSDIILLYKQTKNILRILNKNEDKTIIITSTEMFADILPALLVKFLRRNKEDVKLIAPIYHFVISRYRNKLDLGALFHTIIQKMEIFLIVHFFDGVITENSYVEQQLLGKNPKLVIVKKSPGVHKKYLANILDREKDIDVVFLGALTKFKGVFDLLDAWRGVDNYKLVIAGYGDNKTVESIRKYISENSIRNVELKPNISEDEKFELLSRTKVYVLPSYVEGIPITFYEAWSRGALVVTYYLPTYVDIKDLIVAARLGDVKDLKEKLLYALKNYEDLKEKLSEKAKEYAFSHEFEKLTTEICEEILKV